MNYRHSLYKLKSIVEVVKPSDIPDNSHFSVMVYETSSYTIPGDERSRTNPGHGYPEHTETVRTVRHYVTINRGEWIDLIHLLAEDREFEHKYAAFESNRPVKVTKKVVVE